MKQKLIVPGLLIVLMLAACNRQQLVKAKVFERREEANSKLFIKYQYNFDGNTFTDSALIENIVIGPDSIQVKLNTSAPQKSEPAIKKEH